MGSVGLSVEVVLRLTTLIESIGIVVGLRFGLVWLDMLLGSSCSFLLFFLILILIFVLIKIIINFLIFLILDILIEILILFILVLIFFLLGGLDLLGCRFNCCFGGSHRLLFRRSSLGLSWEFSWH